MSDENEQDRMKVLCALLAMTGASAEDEEYFWPFAPIMEHTNLSRNRVRLACRVLKRRGHVAFKAGLWTEDGEPAGSGYTITKAGIGAVTGRAIAA